MRAIAWEYDSRRAASYQAGWKGRRTATAHDWAVKMPTNTNTYTI